MYPEDLCPTKKENEMRSKRCKTFRMPKIAQGAPQRNPAYWGRLAPPFDIASCAQLLSVPAHVTGYEAGDFVHKIGDAHVYSNHMDQMKTQSARAPKSLPQLRIKRDVSSIFDFRYDDVEITGYDPDPHISAPVAV